VRSQFQDRFRAALGPGSEPNPIDLVGDVTTLSAPILAVAAVFALAIGLLQTRGASALGRGRRTSERPRRLASLFDGRRTARAAMGVVVFTTIAFVVLGNLRRVAPDIARVLPSPERALSLPDALFSTFAVPIAAILVAGAAVDYWLEHRFWLARLRMSPQQIKEERREQEGDPLVRQARRRSHSAHNAATSG
jgi:flagellar biosynthetic protein FlhB